MGMSKWRRGSGREKERDRQREREMVYAAPEATQRPTNP
jgi:hypothetical protein